MKAKDGFPELFDVITVPSKTATVTTAEDGTTVVAPRDSPFSEISAQSTTSSAQEKPPPPAEGVSGSEGEGRKFFGVTPTAAGSAGRAESPWAEESREPAYVDSGAASDGDQRDVIDRDEIQPSPSPTSKAASAAKEILASMKDEARKEGELVADAKTVLSSEEKSLGDTKRTSRSVRSATRSATRSVTRSLRSRSKGRSREIIAPPPPPPAVEGCGGDAEGAADGGDDKSTKSKAGSVRSARSARSRTGSRRGRRAEKDQGDNNDQANQSRSNSRTRTRSRSRPRTPKAALKKIVGGGGGGGGGIANGPNANKEGLPPLPPKAKSGSKGSSQDEEAAGAPTTKKATPEATPEATPASSCRSSRRSSPVAAAEAAAEAEAEAKAATDEKLSLEEPVEFAHVTTADLVADALNLRVGEGMEDLTAEDATTIAGGIESKGESKGTLEKLDEKLECARREADAAVDEVRAAAERMRKLAEEEEEGDQGEEGEEDEATKSGGSKQSSGSEERKGEAAPAKPFEDDAPAAEAAPGRAPTPTAEVAAKTSTSADAPSAESAASSGSAPGGASTEPPAAPQEEATAPSIPPEEAEKTPLSSPRSSPLKGLKKRFGGALLSKGSKTPERGSTPVEAPAASADGAAAASDGKGASSSSGGSGGRSSPSFPAVDASAPSAPADSGDAPAPAEDDAVGASPTGGTDEMLREYAQDLASAKDGVDDMVKAMEKDSLVSSAGKDDAKKEEGGEKEDAKKEEGGDGEEAEKTVAATIYTAQETTAPSAERDVAAGDGGDGTHTSVDLNTLPSKPKSSLSPSKDEKEDADQKGAAAAPEAKKATDVPKESKPTEPASPTAAEAAAPLSPKRGRKNGLMRRIGTAAAVVRHHDQRRRGGTPLRPRASPANAEVGKEEKSAASKSTKASANSRSRGSLRNKLRSKMHVGRRTGSKQAGTDRAMAKIDELANKSAEKTDDKGVEDEEKESPEASKETTKQAVKEQDSRAAEASTVKSEKRREITAQKEAEAASKASPSQLSVEELVLNEGGVAQEVEMALPGSEEAEAAGQDEEADAKREEAADDADAQEVHEKNEQAPLPAQSVRTGISKLTEPPPETSFGACTRPLSPTAVAKAAIDDAGKAVGDLVESFNDGAACKTMSVGLCKPESDGSVESMDFLKCRRNDEHSVPSEEVDGSNSADGSTYVEGSVKISSDSDGSVEVVKDSADHLEKSPSVEEKSTSAEESAERPEEASEGKASQGDEPTEQVPSEPLSPSSPKGNIELFPDFDTTTVGEGTHVTSAKPRAMDSSAPLETRNASFPAIKLDGMAGGEDIVKDLQYLQEMKSEILSLKEGAPSKSQDEGVKDSPKEEDRDDAARPADVLAEEVATREGAQAQKAEEAAKPSRPVKRRRMKTISMKKLRIGASKKESPAEVQTEPEKEPEKKGVGKEDVDDKEDRANEAAKKQVKSQEEASPPAADRESTMVEDNPVADSEEAPQSPDDAEKEVRPKAPPAAVPLKKRGVSMKKIRKVKFGRAAKDGDSQPSHDAHTATPGSQRKERKVRGFARMRSRSRSKGASTTQSVEAKDKAKDAAPVAPAVDEASRASASQASLAEAMRLKEKGKIRLEKSMRDLKEKQETANAKREVAEQKANEKKALEQELKDELHEIKISRQNANELQKKKRSRKSTAAKKQDIALQKRELAAALKKADIAKAKLEQAKAEREAARVEAEAIAAREEAKQVLEDLKEIKHRARLEQEMLEQNNHRDGFAQDRMGRQPDQLPPNGMMSLQEFNVKGEEDRTMVSELTGHCEDIDDIDDDPSSNDRTNRGLDWWKEEGNGLGLSCAGFTELFGWFMGEDNSTKEQQKNESVSHLSDSRGD